MVIGILLTNRRAGCPPDSQQMKDLLTALSKSDAVETFGFYSRMSLILSPAYRLPQIFFFVPQERRTRLTDWLLMNRFRTILRFQSINRSYEILPFRNRVCQCRCEIS
jgi:hypothetical protein